MVTNEYDVIVIGGGLLGCFTARALTRYDLKVALLEKREDLCTGISRANASIVYSGCDMKPGTRKAEMCVKAAQSFPALCDELGVRYSACGSVMVCFGERGAAVLRKKFDQGTLSGVRGMRLLTRDEVLELEPNIAGHVHSGLFVPDTGTVMPWELCFAAAENAASNGADILLQTEVVAAQSAASGRGYTIRTSRGDYFARAVVNCAGLAADEVLEMAFEPVVRIVPSAGDFYVLDTKAAGHIRHVIFHEPEEKGKGLTLVPTVDGNTLIGSTERPVSSGKWKMESGKIKDEDERGKWKMESGKIKDEDAHGKWKVENVGADALGSPRGERRGECGDFFATAAEGLGQLRSLVAEVMPTLPMEHVISSFGAVRPNPYLLLRDENGGLVTDDRSINEFCIIEADDGPFISFVGVKTPGLTCSSELGEYAAQKIAAQLSAAPNVLFDPRREPAPRLSEMPFDERDALIRISPDYGKIVCRCRGTSEGEIVDAIRRFPGAVTLDGVKRRTGADSGRCQGGYCTQRIIEILAREFGCGVEDITKDGGNSRILV